tara:strand:+ start:6456 stop:6644 length:189 start_codon:yes stop_codon:yes gene_type:complete
MKQIKLSEFIKHVSGCEEYTDTVNGKNYAVFYHTELSDEVGFIEYADHGPVYFVHEELCGLA